MIQTTTSPVDAALTRLDELIPPDDLLDTEPTQLVRTKIRALLVGYDSWWKSDDWKTIATEQEFHLPIVNPDTSRSSRSFTLAGKFDGIAVYKPSGKTYLVEHKTTSDAIIDPAAPYWRRLVIDSQVSAYMLAAWQSGQRLDGTLYDVVRKPSIRPKKISKADQKTIAANRTYCGDFVCHCCHKAETETLHLYEIRLKTDIEDQPERYFARRSVPRIDDEIIEYAEELRDIARTIGETRRLDRHYRNDDTCFNWSRVCPYLDLCTGADSTDSDHWERLSSVHQELEEIEGAGHDVLTVSRIKTFKSCRRKHFYRYEQGLVPRREDDAGALFFGTVWHDCLAAWWNSFRQDTAQ